MSEPKETGPEPSYRLPTDGLWPHAWKITAALAVVGFVACFLTYDPHRFGFSWLFGFMSFLAIGLGGMFVTMAVHITGAGWAVTPRRTAEFLMAGLPVFLILWAPLYFHMEEVYPWTHYQDDGHHEEGEHGEGEHHEDGEHHDEAEGQDEHGSLFGPSVAHAQDHEGGHGEAADHGESHGDEGHGAGGDHHDDPEHHLHSEIIRSKTGYLNNAFWLGRALFYLLVWLALSVWLFRSSTTQDKVKGLAITKRLETFAPIGIAIFALTLTFAAFDWMMSLEPAWFSTMFGVQYFAVCAVSSLATIILIAMGLRSAGVMGDAITVEHFHDLGKLLFGFVVFWAYVSFSQFMLIWYAGIPEEATYYHLRGDGAWQNVSTLLVVCHFAIPFVILLSRNAKRRLPILAFGAVWLLVMHVMEIFWLVMPYATQSGLVNSELVVSPLDFAALFAVGGTYLTVVFLVMGQNPLIPLGDPRLSRAMHHEVV